MEQQVEPQAAEPELVECPPQPAESAPPMGTGLIVLGEPGGEACGTDGTCW